MPCIHSAALLHSDQQVGESSSPALSKDAEVKVGQHFGCPFPPHFRRQRWIGFGVNHGAQKPWPSLRLYLHDGS